MKITLIRHGRTKGNTEKRYIGFTDESLCDTASLNLSYPKADTVISSDMRRALMSAEYIYPDKKITVCQKLRECNFGEFENKSYDDLKDNADYRKWIAGGGSTPPPGGENNNHFKSRCMEGFYESLKSAGDSAVFVIHGGTIMAVMQTLFGGGFYDYQIRCGGMFTFDYDKTNKKATGNFVREE